MSADLGALVASPHFRWMVYAAAGEYLTEANGNRWVEGFQSEADALVRALLAAPPKETS